MHACIRCFIVVASLCARSNVGTSRMSGGVSIPYNLPYPLRLAPRAILVYAHTQTWSSNDDSQVVCQLVYFFYFARSPVSIKLS